MVQKFQKGKTKAEADSASSRITCKEKSVALRRRDVEDLDHFFIEDLYLSRFHAIKDNRITSQTAGKITFEDKDHTIISRGGQLTVKWRLYHHFRHLLRRSKKERR
jgi:hypothetical protein